MVLILGVPPHSPICNALNAASCHTLGRSINSVSESPPNKLKFLAPPGRFQNPSRERAMTCVIGTLVVRGEDAGRTYHAEHCDPERID